MPIGHPRKLLLNHVADQKELAAAKKGADHKGGERRNKHHGNAADYAGNGKRQYNADKRIKMIRAQIMGGVDHICVNLCQSIVQGQDHKGQEVVYHAENDCCRCVDDL